MGERYVVLPGLLRLRKTASSPEVLVGLPRGQMVEKRGETTDWCAVKTELKGTKYEGYVASKYLMLANPPGGSHPLANAACEMSKDRLLVITPGADLRIIEQLANSFSKTTGDLFKTSLTLCHFVAQAAHESDGFRTLEEIGEPDYFKKYDGRKDLDNIQPGDGYRYRGRGIIQLTGRFNYRKIGTILKVDLEAAPDSAAEPAMSLLTACEYWKSHDLGYYANRNDITGLTKQINPGLRGLEERKHYFRCAWAIWGTLGKYADQSNVTLQNGRVPNVIAPPLS